MMNTPILTRIMKTKFRTVSDTMNVAFPMQQVPSISCLFIHLSFCVYR
jgi:hypothetical protein